MELALGTVQFGLKYGIAGRGEAVPADEVRAILRTAADRGVRILDTAAAYGDIEPRLAELCGDLPFAVVSKIPQIPAGLDGKKAVAWALNSAMESRRRLGKQLNGLMFHHSNDLAGPQGQEIWNGVHAWTESEGIKLGVSCYAPDDMAAVQQNLSIEIAQLPGNVLDQRVQGISVAPKCEMHLRSVFLQGLLLLPVSMVQRRLPQAIPALERWHRWYGEKGLDPLQAALSVVKSFQKVSAVVVGVDNLDQFIGIVDAWQKAEPLTAAELNEPNLDIIDPRRWNNKAS